MQNVIAAKDFDLYLRLDAIGFSYKITTGANFSATISGTTEDIHAFSTAEPIDTDNGGNTYDITFSLQKAEAIRIKSALATATANEPGGSYAHIRQIVGSAVISAVWRKERDVPRTSTVETYTQCTGVEENDNVERASTETLTTWQFRARGMILAEALL